MACLAVSTELGCGMRRIVGLVVIIQVTADTNGRSRVIITVVALVTIIDRGMCTCQRPVVIVDCEGGRFPTRIGSMAIGACRGDMYSLMTRICRGVVVGQMT